MIKMKKIGILGGMSHESTIKYYNLLLQKYYNRYQDYHYPEILIYSLNFQKVIDYELGDNEGIYIDYWSRFYNYGRKFTSCGI